MCGVVHVFGNMFMVALPDDCVCRHLKVTSVYE